MSCKNARSIWAVCGTGFLLDVMWGMTLTLVWPNAQRELGFSDKEFGNIWAAFSAGMAVGSFVWGVLVDVIGSLLVWTSLLVTPIILTGLIVWTRSSGGVPWYFSDRWRVWHVSWCPVFLRRYAGDHRIHRVRRRRQRTYRFNQ